MEKEEIVLKTFDLKGMAASFLVELIVVGITNKKGELLGGIGGYVIPKSILILKDDGILMAEMGEKEREFNFEEGLEGIFREVEGTG